MHKPNVLCNPLCVLSGTLLCTKRHPIIHGNFDLIWFNLILSFFRIFFSFLLFEIIGKNGMAAVPGYSTWDPRKQGQIFLFLFFSWVIFYSACFLYILFTFLTLYNLFVGGQCQGEAPYQEIPYGDGPGPRGPVPDVPQHYAQVPPVPQRQGWSLFLFLICLVCFVTLVNVRFPQS